MLTRRQFVKLIVSATAALQVSDFCIPQLAAAFAEKKKPTVIWLELMTCSGDYLSVANTLHPNMRQLLFETVNLQFSNTSMTAEGNVAIQHLMDTVDREKGEFILIAEGTIPLKAEGRYGAIGHHPDGRLFTNLEAIKYIAPKAKYIMALGSCAAFGGPYAASPNPSGSVAVDKVIDEQVINVPGCPVHPDWAVGTLTHLMLYGVPELDAYNRPKLFYGARIHDWCPRRQHFDNGVFSEEPGEEKCAYKIGCKGPVTFSDCPTRQWIGEHNNWPVGANSPCIGCVSPDFPDGMSPFYEHLPKPGVLGLRTTSDKLGLGVAAVAAGGIGTHLVATVATGRLGRNWVGGTVPKPEGINRDVRKHAGDKYKEVVFVPDKNSGEARIRRYYAKDINLEHKEAKGLYNQVKGLFRATGNKKRIGGKR